MLKGISIRLLLPCIATEICSFLCKKTSAQNSGKAFQIVIAFQKRTLQESENHHWMKKENDLPKFTFLKNCLLGRHVVDLRKPLIPLGFLWPFVLHVNSKNPWSVRTSFRSSFTASPRSWKFHMVHLKISPWKIGNSELGNKKHVQVPWVKPSGVVIFLKSPFFFAFLFFVSLFINKFFGDNKPWWQNRES